MDLNLNKSTGVLTAPLFQPALNRHILDCAKPNLVHQQFGRKVTVPKGKGKAVVFDKMCRLPMAKTPLVEGVTPNGRAISMTRVTALPKQYGDYVSTTDEFDYFAYDPSPRVLEINESLGRQAGETMDSLAADVLAGAKNVQFPNQKASRSALTETDVLTVTDIRKAVRTLKGNNAPKINGKYIALIHTDVAYDIMSDPDWKYPHQYVDTKNIYEGEIGELYGVKFVETTQAKIFRGEALCDKYEELTVYSVEGTKITIAEELTETEAQALASKEVVIDGKLHTVSQAVAGLSGKAVLTMSEDMTELAAADMKIYPAGGAANGKNVYSTIVLGADAYGVTSAKGNIENITKPLGSAGSADPLNQRATVGWKAHFVCQRLDELNMVRIESVASRD